MSYELNVWELEFHNGLLIRLYFGSEVGRLQGYWERVARFMDVFWQTTIVMDTATSVGPILHVHWLPLHGYYVL